MPFPLPTEARGAIFAAGVAFAVGADAVPEGSGKAGDGAVAREIAAVMVSARRDLDAASPVARLLLCSYH